MVKGNILGLLYPKKGEHTWFVKSRSRNGDIMKGDASGFILINFPLFAF